MVLTILGGTMKNNQWLYVFKSHAVMAAITGGDPVVGSERRLV